MYNIVLLAAVAMMSNKFLELTHIIAGRMYPLTNISSCPTTPTISYIEGYQYKARTLRVGYTIGLLLSAFETID